MIERSGQAGAWNKALHNPLPDKVYLVDDRHTFVTDADSRVVHANSTLEYRDGDATRRRRNGYQQSRAGRSDRLRFDEGGHIIAASLGGPGEGINLVAMSKKLNGPGRDNWNVMENRLRTALKEDPTAEVKFTVDIDYYPGSRRPRRFGVSYSINDGAEVRRWFVQ